MKQTAKNEAHECGPPRRGLSLKARKTLVGFSFILPNFIGFFCFILIPVVFSFVLSVMNWDGFNEMTFAGVDNFKMIFKDRVFKAALKNTVFFSVFGVLLTAFLALTLAILINRKIKGISVFRSAIFFPYVAPVVAVAAVWNALFMRDFGPVNSMLQAMGVANPPGWFTSTTWALLTVSVVWIWKNMGYYMILYLAGLQDVPRQLYEAAEVDGASRWNQIRYITFPMLTPVHFFVIIMLTINSFKTFDLVYALTQGGPGTSTTMLSQYIYNQSFEYWDFGRAAAASVILFLIVGTITIIQFRYEKKFNDFL